MSVNTIVLKLTRNGKRYSVDLTPFLYGSKAENAWEESKHPRDKDGKFSKSGEEPSQSNEKRGKVKRRRKALSLPKEEFARVQHAFMTDVTREQREMRCLVKNIGNYRYTAVLREDGTRDIVGKVKIDGID